MEPQTLALKRANQSTTARGAGAHLKRAVASAHADVHLATRLQYASPRGLEAHGSMILELRIES